MMKCKFRCAHFISEVFKMDNSMGNIENCSCDEPEVVENEVGETSPSKDKRSKINLFGLCRDKSYKRNKKSPTASLGSGVSSGKTIAKKSPKWGIKFNCTKKETKTAFNSGNQSCCRCTCYKHSYENEGFAGQSTSDFVEDHERLVAADNPPSVSSKSECAVNEMDIVEPNLNQQEEHSGSRGLYSVVSNPLNNISNLIVTPPFSNVHWMRQHEDTEEAARIARAREIEQGVEAPANFVTVRRVQLLCSDLEADCGQPQGPPRRLQLVCPPDLSVESLRALFQTHVTLKSCPVDNITGCHTQVDFIHCLVPDLLTITNCTFYWGKMDRYEAERLLDGKPEGTFLLRDSAQEEFLFSVSFRKYGRSLHARIEQWNHKFSFDSHDPGVYTSNTVCGLIEHYKDPSSCMFFEPILTLPLHRKFTFSLQHLARAAIVSRLTYDNINHLQLPKTLKTYLKEYHYRQKVRVERFDDDVQWLELGNTPT